MQKFNSTFFKGKFVILIVLLATITISPFSSSDSKEDRAFILFSDSFEVGLDGWDLVRCQSQTSGFEYIPPVLDTSTAAQGKTSLKIINHRQDVILLETKSIPLIPKQRYTVSLYLKTDHPGSTINVSLKRGIRNIIIKHFKLDDQWKRYSLSLMIPRSRNQNYRIFLSFKDKATLWIDGVQLEKGELSALDFNPLIRFSAKTERKNNLFIKGEKPQVTISVFNHSSKDQKVIIDYTIKDFFQHEIAQSQLELYCKKGESAKNAITLPFDSTGIFKARFSLKYKGRGNKRQTELIYAIIPKRNTTGLKQDSPFGIHLQFLAFSRQNDNNIYERVYPSRCNLEDYFRWAESIGAKWLRDRAFLAWSYIEPRKEEFNWFDQYLDLAEKYHLNVLGNLRIYGKVFDKRPWGKSQDPGKKNRSIPSLEAWEDYVRAVVSRYKDRVKYWEVWNEPNVRFLPQQYIELLKTTYSTAKAIDPNCKIVAPACMVMRGPRRNFLKDILALGAGNYCDIFSVHFYMKPLNLPPEKTTPTLQKTFEIYKKMIEDYGGEQELWDSESGYFVRSYYEDINNELKAGKGKSDQNSITAEEQANYLVRSYIIHIANGAKWFYFNLGNRTIHAYGSRGLIEYDTTPLPAMVAYAVLSSKLEGMRYETKIDMSKGNECYIFSKKDEKSKSRPLFLIVAWNWQVVSQAVEWYLAIPPSKLKVYNVMGGEVPIEPNNKGFLVKISDSPLYLESSEFNLDDLTKAFQSASDNY